jgi:hypothetical protein
MLPMNKPVTCPFCLGLSEFHRFLMSTKQGISHSLGVCPLCGQGLQLKTLKLMSECTPEQFAEWIHKYKGFWRKVTNFNRFRDRLWIMGWTKPFWRRYYALKAEDKAEGMQEGYADYMNRLGREQAEEWNRQDRERSVGNYPQ